MSGFAFVYSDVPEKLLELLAAQLPFSLPLLRRLQSTKFKNGASPTARTILVSDTDGFNDGSSVPEKFTAAYIDIGGDRDTQMWLYSTFENPPNVNDPEAAKVCEDQLATLVNEIVILGKAFKGTLFYPGCVLLGTLNTAVREVWMKSGRVEPRPTGLCDKWLFKTQNIPNKGDDLPDGMHWSQANVADCEVVVSRTHIPRTVKSLSRMPSMVIKLDDGTPISWAFLGFDGSLVSLHVEEPYRRQGLAKKLASKLLREKTFEFGSDGWSCADVSISNEGSRSMCKSLGGESLWTVSWVLLNIQP